MSHKHSRSRSRHRHLMKYKERARRPPYDDLSSSSYYYLNHTNNNYYYHHHYNHSHSHNHNHYHNHHHYHHHHHHEHRDHRDHRNDRNDRHHYYQNHQNHRDRERERERDRDYDRKRSSWSTKTKTKTKPKIKTKTKTKIKPKMKTNQSMEDEDIDNNNSQNGDDLEGTVNLKNVESIYRKRYRIGSKLGQGTFGLVMECIDNKRKMSVAVKIVRSVQRYLDAAEIEVDILNKLDEFDIYKNSLIIRLYKSFRCFINGVEHSCLVFEKCGRSLYDYIKKNKYSGFTISIIACIAYQLFHSISFCHLNKLTHTDLKLENVLFVSDEYIYDKRLNLYLPKDSLQIRLIDFGGATFESDHHSSIINTRQYRGPEVILSLKWSYPSDIWSIGCILAELYCGELLFATHHDLEHLQLIKKILNIQQFPSHMINEQNIHLFDINNSNQHNINSKYIEKCKRLNQMIKHEKLFDLIYQCLQIDPSQRITASQAKCHPFFQQFRNSNIENVEFNKIYDMINHRK